jgi:glycine/sarcosine N-methyltransferase
MDFYDRLADDYDEMTRFRQRLERERETVRGWVDRFGLRSALDAACGTGLHAVLLASLGVRTVGVDIAESMLDKAREHGRETGVAVTWIPADMTNLPRRVKGAFDAVFCLGNSIPHLLRLGDLKAALRGFRQILHPEGVVLLQLLNYDRVLERRERIINVNREGKREYVRFYDFLPKRVLFNILRITELENDRLVHDLQSTMLRPYRKSELVTALSGCGFSRIEIFGDLTFSPFDPGISPNLFITARRQNGCR